MGFFVDIAVLIILISFTVIGYRKGFIKSVMGLVSLALSIIIAINFYTFAASFINEHIVGPHFSKITAEEFSSLMNGGTETISPEKIFEDNPDSLEKLLNKFGVELESVTDFYETNIKPTVGAFETDKIADKLSGFVVESTTDVVSNIIGFILTFLAALIVFNLLLKLLDLLFKLPVLKFTNKLFGAILGVVKGLAVALIVVNVVSGLVFAVGDVDNSFWNRDSLKTSTAYSTALGAGLIVNNNQ